MLCTQPQIIISSSECGATHMKESSYRPLENPTRSVVGMALDNDVAVQA